MNTLMIVTAIGLFMSGVAMTLLLGYRWVEGALRDNFIDGAAAMLDQAKAMQQYAYRELAGEPNRDIILHTLDSVVEGLQNNVRELREENRT